jgi:hypothetical protein
MSVIFVALSGGRTSGDGGTEGSALDLVTAKGIAVEGDTLRLLQGVFKLDGPIDLRNFPDVALAGDGAVTLDGQGEHVGVLLGPGGNRCSVSKIRFQDCVCPVEVEDGTSEFLVVDCFDYETVPIEGGKSFTAGFCTGGTFKNLTTTRSGNGISAGGGVTILNCVSTAVPAFSGRVYDRFQSRSHWAQMTGAVTSNLVLTENVAYSYGADMALYLSGTNISGGNQYVKFQRHVALEDALDLSAATILRLVICGIDLSGLVAAADAVRVTLGSPAGTHRFDFSDTSIIEGFETLVIDLAAPAATVGVPDLAAATIFAIEILTAPSGRVSIVPSEISAINDVVVLTNGVPEHRETDPMAFFRAGGLNVSANPPPFISAARQDYRYDPTSVDFPTFVSAGTQGFPMGSIFQGGHIYTQEEPGHYRFQSHRFLSSWENDETFFDTTLGQPGVDGEGLSNPVNENGSAAVAINAGTINIIAISGAGVTRDLDDDSAWEFDKSAGAETEVGIEETWASPVDGTGAVGLSIEKYLPAAAIAELGPDGLVMQFHSAGGYVSGKIEAEDLIAGWNEVVVDLADPFDSSGAFDVSAWTHVRGFLSINPSVSIPGFRQDHAAIVMAFGYSSAPVEFTPQGFASINLSLYPEGRVSRIVSDFDYVRKPGPFLRAYWQALEGAADGAFVNVAPRQQQLSTRTIEVRLSEYKTTRYGVVMGVLARDWIPISRVSRVDIPERPLWIQRRMMLRNRTNTTEP